MTSVPPSLATSDESEIPLDLNTAFKHPAGLRAAKYLVRTLVVNAWMSGQAADPLAQNTFYSVSPSLLGSTSPEVASLLNDILAFSETESSPPGQREVGVSRSLNTNDGFEAARQGKAIQLPKPLFNFTESVWKADTIFPAQSPASSIGRLSQHISNIDNPLPKITNISHNRPSPQSMHNSSNELPSFLTGTSSQSQTGPFQIPVDMELDSFISRSSSTQGTESPYHVESPSGRISIALSSNALPQRSIDKHSLLSGLSNPEDDPIELDRLPPNSIRLVNSNQYQNHPENNLFLGMGRPSSLSEFIPFNRAPTSYTPYPPRDPPTTIKSFLPVNKTTAENNGRIHNSKDLQSLLSHSPLSNRPLVAERALARSYSPTSLHGSLSTSLHSSLMTSRSFNSKSPFSEVTDSGVESSTETMTEKKRKSNLDGPSQGKKQKLDNANKAKRIPKSKDLKPEPVS
jgi:hypothetical protein